MYSAESKDMMFFLEHLINKMFIEDASVKLCRTQCMSHFIHGRFHRANSVPAKMQLWSIVNKLVRQWWKPMPGQVVEKLLKVVK